MRKKYFVLLFGLVFLSSTIFATAIDQTNIGIRGTSLGGAFTGVADDSSAVFWNAAGLAFYEGKGEVNVGLFMPYITLENEIAQGSYAGDTTKSQKLNLIPSLFAVYKITDDLAIGFGLYFPYGGGKISYDDAYDYDSIILPSHLQNKMSLEKDLRAYTFTLSAAYKIGDIFSVGVGFTMYYLTLDIKTTNKFLGATADPYFIYGDTEQFVKKMAFSGNIGIMVKPMKTLTLGLSVRLPASAKLEGDFKIKNSVIKDGTGTTIATGSNDGTSDSYKELTAPLSIGFGAGYYIMKNWLVSMDIEYQMWKMSKDIDQDNDTSTSSDETKKYGWKNTIRFGIGTEYKIMPELAILVGFKLAPSAPEDQFLGLDNVDLTAHAFFLGFGLKPMDFIKIEGVFSYVHYPDQEQDTVDSDAVVKATGKFKKNIIGGGIQVKVIF